jgi:hypothetical protein
MALALLLSRARACPQSPPLLGTPTGPPVPPAVGRLLSSRPVSSRPVSAPVRPDASVSSHAQAVAVGTKVELAGRPWPPERVEAPVAAKPSTARATVAEAGTRATLPKSRWSVGGGWRTRAAGLGGGRGGRACPLSDQAGQAGVRSARRGRLRGGHGSRLREVAAAAAWLPSSGWGARPRWVVVAEPDARVGGPGGARGGAGGDGHAAPARPKPAASAPSSLPAAL